MCSTYEQNAIFRRFTMSTKATGMKKKQAKKLTAKAKKPVKNKSGRKRGKSSSIKTKILIPITALTLVILASGVLNILSMNRMQEGSTALTDKSLPVLTALETAIADFSDLQRIIYAHTISEKPSQMEEYEQKADELFAEVNASLATYEAGISSEEDMQLIEDFRSNLELYTYTYGTAEELSRNMMKTLAQSYVPNLMQTSANTMQTQLQTMKQNIQANIDREVQVQQSSYKQAVITTILATLIGFMIALFAVALVNRSVIRPIKKSTQSLDRIVEDIQDGHGDLTARIDLKTNDELGRLAKGINVFLETLQNIMSQIVSNAEIGRASCRARV